MDAAMTRQRFLAFFMWLIDGVAWFSYGNEDAPTFMPVRAGDWHDMGEPKIITISITPGDLLNG